MSSYKPIDSKREEFRKYLERTGVMDGLTKALVALYEETDKPEDALGYIQNFLGTSGGSSGGGGGGGDGNSNSNEGADESSKALQKQMEDLKVKSDKSEPVLKGGGDQANLSQKQEEMKTVAECLPVGAEGDAPTAIIPKEGSDLGITDVQGSGKHQLAEPVPPEGVAS